MLDNELNQLFDAVKKDDCETFFNLTKNTRLGSTCFGRFPVLSLMYLYGSDKLVKNFEKKLLDVGVYTVVDEPEEIYPVFKEKAKKCLRLYVDKDAVVSPLEMLLILGRGAHFWHAYPSAAKNATVKNNINAICNMVYGSPPTKKSGRLAAPVLPLKKKNKILVLAAFVVAGVFALLAVFGFIFGVSTNGKTEKSPFIVAGGESFTQALNKAQERYYDARGEGSAAKTYLELSRDVTIDSLNGFTEHLFADIDGNGYKITFTQPLTKSVFNYIVGSVTDVTFVFTLDMTVKDFTGALANVVTADGSLTDCVFLVGGSITVQSDYEYSADYFPVGLAIGANGGKITGCTVTTDDLTVTGYEHANFVLGGLVGVNEGEITDCKSSLSGVTVDTVDFGGVVAFNQKGKVEKCESELDLSLTTRAGNWLINAGGICYSNLSALTECRVTGELTVNSAEASGVLLGGITVYNQNVINKCSNSANMTVNADGGSTAEIYLGGIAAVNSKKSEDNPTVRIENCFADGKIEVNVSGDGKKKPFIGGICAQSGAELKNNFFNGSITAEKTDTAYIGGITAGISEEIASEPTEFLSENYYTGNGYTDGVAFKFDEEGLITSLDRVEGIEYCTEEELKAKEIYRQ